MQVLISKMQTMKEIVNPPKGHGLWALCIPLAFFIDGLYKMMKSENKIPFDPQKWIKRLTHSLEENMNEEEGRMKDIRCSG